MTLLVPGNPVPLENRICVVTCGSSGYQAARIFVDQAAQDGFTEDPSAVEVGNSEVATVDLPSGTRWALPWCGRFSGGPDRAELDVLTIPARQRLIKIG
jgi:hypothetical protein